MIRTLIAAAAIAAATPAAAVTVTFDPAAAGLAGAAFSFDALQGYEVSRIDNTFYPDNSLTFTEVGFLAITGATLNGAPVAASGLGVDYTLYMTFDVSGGAPSIVVPGQFTTADIKLYGANGMSVFDFDANNLARVTNQNAPVLLFDSKFLGGSLGANVISPPPALALDIFANLDLEVTDSAPGFITSPTGVPLVADLDAQHASSTVTVLNGGLVFLVNGGPDVVTFAVDAPPAIALFGLAAGLIAATRRR